MSPCLATTLPPKSQLLSISGDDMMATSMDASGNRSIPDGVNQVWLSTRHTIAVLP